MRWIYIGIAIIVVMLLWHGQSPEAAAPYVGTWKSEHATLTISHSGRMTYRREQSDARVGEEFFNVPIQQVSEAEIIGAIADARLEIEEPPHKVGDSWQMTANGDVLTRQ